MLAELRVNPRMPENVVLVLSAPTVRIWLAAPPSTVVAATRPEPSREPMLRAPSLFANTKKPLQIMCAVPPDDVSRNWRTELEVPSTVIVASPALALLENLNSEL